jgi:hypothetical protein
MTPDWLTAIGTLAAVVVALLLAIFHEHLRALCWHPALELLYEHQPPDSHLTTLTNRQTGVQAACYYFRIRVRNGGNARAKNVEVFVEEVSHRRADGVFQRQEDFLPLNLLWSHYGQPYFPSIPPGVYKHCDFGHVVDPSLRNKFPREDHERLGRLGMQPSQTALCLELVVRPNTGTHLILPGPEPYRFVVVAAAANARLVRRTIEVKLTGQWTTNERHMLSDAIGLRLL